MQNPPVSLQACPSDPALRAMFEARKRVFVDLLKWDVPVLDGAYEIDQFDTPDASYLVLTDGEGRHRASARLLRTDGAHILGELFPCLCDGPIANYPQATDALRLEQLAAVHEFAEARRSKR